MRIAALCDGREIASAELPETNGSLTIGRLPECDVVLDCAAVSRRHARLHIINGACFIEDTRSGLGVTVNGTRIADVTAVDESSVIGIERFTLRLVFGSVPSAPAPASAPEAVAPFVPANAPEPAPRSAPSSAPDPASQPTPAPVDDAPAPKEKSSDGSSFATDEILYRGDVMALMNAVHETILERLNLSESALKDKNSKEITEKVCACLDGTLNEIRHRIPVGVTPDKLRQAILDELLGLGPLSQLLRDRTISEIMVNGPDNVFVEIRGTLTKTAVRFKNEQHLVAVIQRIVEPLGRHIDEASPMVDARLEDGSRVNAVIPPLALRGASLTIRKFADSKLTSEDLVRFGSMTKDMADFLRSAVTHEQNIVVSGGTGSGKTTLLNVLSQSIPRNKRVVTVEDSAELKLDIPNLVSLEARPANIEGKGQISIRQLVINTLRMRPDRIIVGECRGPEAFDMLQAMNTGHNGSLTTAHANNPRDVLMRLENMVMMAGFDLPSQAIREQISSAINLIVQQTRFADGSRRVTAISEITGREGDKILMQDIYVFKQTGFTPKGNVLGYHTATGNIPQFIHVLRQRNKLDVDMKIFVPQN